MGLDNYWKQNDGNDGFVAGEFNVCGGICSGNGNDSFRGKVYNSIVENVTGVSLYNDKIPSDKIHEMNQKIQNCSLETAKEHSSYDIGKEEWDNFKKMWDAHTKANHYLVSWW